MKRLIFLILILCSISYGENDFSGDPNCVALWRFESGALATDSQGGNDWNTYLTPAADTVIYKEGAASCDFDNTDAFYLSSAELDAGYPLKNGDVTKNISLCYWFYADSLPGSGAFWRLYMTEAVGKYSINTYISNTAGTTTWECSIGYNSGNSWEDLTSISTGLTAERWYFVGLTFQNSDKSYRIRIRDGTTGLLLGGAEVTGNSTNNINVEDGGTNISQGTSGYSWVGKVDEMSVFNDILSAAEIDQIYAGTFGAAASVANEIRAFVPGATTCYSIVREVDGDVWYVAGDTFEVWGGGAGRDMDDYDIAMVDKSGDMFTGAMDTDISEGYYHILTFIRVGDDPADTDPAVWQEYGYWSGTEWQPQNLKTIEDKVDTIAIDVAGLDGDAMRGTDGVSLVVPDAAGTAAALHAVTDALIEEVIARLKRIWAYP